MPVASARPYRERQSNQSPRAPGQRARGGGCSFWTSQNAASLKEKLDCALAAGWQLGETWREGDSKAPGSAAATQQLRLLMLDASMRSGDRRNLHFSLGGRGAIQMLLTNLLPFGRNHHNSSAVEPLPLNLAKLSMCRLR